MCFVKKRNIVFMPCSHTLLCHLCVAIMGRTGYSRCMECGLAVQGTRKLLHSHLEEDYKEEVDDFLKELKQSKSVNYFN